MINELIKNFSAHVDLIEFVISVAGSLLCVYLAQVILREKAPYITLQRIALFALAVAMFGNGVSEYEPWNLVEGVYRPTGIIVYVVLFANLAVMAFRGRIMRQNGHHHDDHD